MNYKAIIGLETHVELKTKSKMFCGCSADYFGKEPNSHTCPVCLGLPGALPVPNKIAIEWCIKIGLALNCEILEFSKFDRKNYFYPDLAKGYQISQYDKPFCLNGNVILQNGKKIRIRRVHMEEDTAKLTHDQGDYSLIDFNRSGVPLVEIVTEPDFENADEVVEYLKKLQQIVRYLEVSDADMEKGQMRLEPNISLSKDGSLPKYKVEVKNINSFRFVERAIKFEFNRQKEILEKGESPKQETRGFSERKNETVSQRSKEEAMDYRYFPEPDIPPIIFSKSQIEKLKEGIGELADEKAKRLEKEYGITSYDAEILTRDKKISDLFESTASTFSHTASLTKKGNTDPKEIANFIINKKVDAETSPEDLASQIKNSNISGVVSPEELENAIEKTISEAQKAIEDYKNGKEQALQFLIGQTMRNLGKKANLDDVKSAILEKLKQRFS